MADQGNKFQPPNTKFNKIISTWENKTQEQGQSEPIYSQINKIKSDKPEQQEFVPIAKPRTKPRYIST